MKEQISPPPLLLSNCRTLLRRALLTSCILTNGASSLIFGSGYLTDLGSSFVIYSQGSAQPYGPYSVVFNAVSGGSESSIKCYIDQNASTEYDDSISAIQLTLGTNTLPFTGGGKHMFSLTNAMFKGGSVIPNTPFVVHIKDQNNSKKKILPLPSSTNVAALNPNAPIISGDVLAFRVINDKVLQKFGSLAADSSALSIKRSDTASDSSGWSDQWFFLSLQGSATPGNTPSTAKLTYTSSATDGSKSFPLSEAVPIKFPIVINSPAVNKGGSVSALNSSDFIVSGTSTASTTLKIIKDLSNSNGTVIESSSTDTITTSSNGSWQYKIPKNAGLSGRYMLIKIQDSNYPLAINTSFTAYFGGYTIEVSAESSEKIPVKISSSLTNSTSAKVRIFNSNNAQVADLGTKSISKASPNSFDVSTVGWESNLSYSLSLFDVTNNNLISSQSLRQAIPEKPTLPPTIGTPSRAISFSINFSNPKKNEVYRLEGSTDSNTWTPIDTPKTAQDNTTDLNFVYTATSLQGLYTVFRITQQSGSNWDQVGENISF